MKILSIVAVLATCFALLHAFGDNIDNSGLRIESREVKCLVCRATTQEIIKAIDKVDPRKRVEVSGFRIDSQGNTITRSVQLSKSETYLTELFETICDTMDDYVKARYKKSKRLTVLSMTGGGFMNPEMSKVDFVQDGDLNKSLKHYCLEILEDHDDAFLAELMKVELGETISYDLCTTSTKYCDEGTEVPEPEPEDEPEEEAQQEEVEPVEEERDEAVASDEPVADEEVAPVADTTTTDADDDDGIVSEASVDEEPFDWLLESNDAKQPEDEHLCKADAGQCDAGAPQPEFNGETNDNEVETDAETDGAQRDEL